LSITASDWNIVPDLLLLAQGQETRSANMGGLIYLIGLIVVILFILSFLGLR
jgi:hypothetical protein